MGVDLGLGGSLIFVGAVFVLVGCLLSINVKKLRERCSLEVPFEVVEWSRVKSSSKHTVKYYPTYLYVVNGVEYRTRSTVDRPRRSIEYATLKVNPDNPNEIYEGLILNYYKDTIICGIPMIIVGLIV